MAAFVLYPHINLPFSNPWHITGLLPLAHVNPVDNIFRFLLFVGAPVLLLGGLRCLPFLRSLYPWGKTPAPPQAPSGQPPPKPATVRKPKAKSKAAHKPNGRRWAGLTVLSFLFCIIVDLNVWTYHSAGPALDFFHEGESLGPSVSLMAGMAPYKDVIFVHGVFQDPLRSVVAFKLFTRSIGAVRTLESIIKMICFLALFAFLLILFDGRHLYAYLTFLALFFAVCGNALIVAPRDVTTFLFLLAAAVLVRAINQPQPQLSAIACIAAAVFSFLPVASLAYSMDRGFYLIATYCVTLPLIAICSPGRPLVRLLGFSALGLALGSLLAGVLMQWQLRAFFDFAILTFPRYKELMDGDLYPFWIPKYLLVVLLISWNAYWVADRFLTALRPAAGGANGPGGGRSFLRAHIMDICLLVLSVCFFRAALGRTDWEHVKYSCVIAYILFCYLAVKYWLHEALQARPSARKKLVRCTVWVAVVVGLAGACCVPFFHLAAEDFPLDKPDAAFLPEGSRQALAFLKANLSPGDSFFTMTSEAAWYYLLDRPSPCRFPVVWFAMPPFYQQEIVRDLQAKRVKIVLYKNTSIYSRLDGFSANERLPIVDAYIRKNYRYYTTVAGNEFWIQNMPPLSPPVPQS